MCARNDNSNNEWVDCPPKLLSQLPKKVDDVERRRFLRVVGAGSLCLISASVLGGVVVKSLKAEPLILNCSQTRSLLSNYKENELDARERQAVLAHLELCGHCHDHFEQQGAAV